MYSWAERKNTIQCDLYRGRGHREPPTPCGAGLLLKCQGAASRGGGRAVPARTPTAGAPLPRGAKWDVPVLHRTERWNWLEGLFIAGQQKFTRGFLRGYQDSYKNQ